MGEAIGQTLPLAVAIAVSPVGIIASVLILGTAKARSNGISFLAGWIIGLLALGGLLLLLNRSAAASSGGDPAGWTGYASIGLGLILLIFAYRQLKKWRTSKGEPDLPGWMSKLDDFDAARSAVAGIALAAVNPKNLILVAGAATAIAGTGTLAGDQVAALLVFTAIASLGVVVPLGIYLFMGDRAEGLLSWLKESMARNGGLIMAVIFVVIAAKLMGDGITTLS
ncbi:MAG: hypothetical protein QG596_18 [Actinomycetota bacterium]|jgi:hypothetical protein|nr:hypothetical protein [Actinomycetota bacterium]